MKMPIQDRKFYIKKHNYEMNSYYKSEHKGINIEGDAINNYSEISQKSELK